jgi:photosystem II stability/assembly factor-like uncharacterized protein
MEERPGPPNSSATDWYSVRFDSEGTGTSWPMRPMGGSSIPPIWDPLGSRLPSFPATPPTSEWFPDSAVAFAVADVGQVFKSLDGGVTWRVTFGADSSVTREDLNAVRFANARIGWAVGNKGLVVVTRDGGATWRIQSTGGTHRNPKGLFVVDTNTVYVFGDQGLVLKTVDGGKNWVAKNPEGMGERAFYGAFFLDAETGWIVGDNATILKTEDGGEHWVMQEGDGDHLLADVVFVSPAVGYVVGTWRVADPRFNRGLVLKTNDGGRT